MGFATRTNHSIVKFVVFQDQDNVQLYLGLTPVGIAIIRDGKKVSGFDW